MYEYFSGAGKVFLNTSQASPALERYQISIYIYTGQNGSGQNGMDKMVYGQNGMDKMVQFYILCTL